MKLAGVHYERDSDGRVQTVVTAPERPAEPLPAPPWTPRVGVDTRDLRDPEKLGRRRRRK